ncbi:MAG: HAD family hydrolase [Chloroflexi bacterium]|nr:HAD family hydrolase [Chloroflexota bacterium]
MGYRIYTASDTESVDLKATLRGMEVRDLFVETYGSDLVGTWKGSHLFYDRILAHAGVPPEKASFVDDSNRSVDWITEAGATAVLISTEGPARTGACEVLDSLSELPEFLAPFRS